MADSGASGQESYRVHAERVWKLSPTHEMAHLRRGMTGERIRWISRPRGRVSGLPQINVGPHHLRRLKVVADQEALNRADVFLVQ